MARSLCLWVVPFVLLASCGSATAVGDPCFDSSECGGGALCIATSLNTKRCMLTCTQDDVLCADGEACVASDGAADLFACLPGGEIGLGSACSESIDCVAGAICLENMGSTCVALCVVGRAGGCADTETCTGLSADRGFCAAN